MCWAGISRSSGWKQVGNEQGKFHTIILVCLYLLTDIRGVLQMSEMPTKTTSAVKLVKSAGNMTTFAEINSPS